MGNTAKLHDLMAADLEVHMEQARIMRRGNRVMAGATIAMAIILVLSIAAGWYVIRQIQEQNEQTIRFLERSLVVRI